VPAFRYEAVDAVGTAKEGVVNADSARAARADLRAQGLVPIAVEAIAAQLDESKQAGSRLFGDRLSTVELALFMRQLASLLEASLPLEQAFSALLEQAERAYVRDLIGSIRSEVMGGASLSDAGAASARLPHFCALVLSGEQTGNGARVCRGLPAASSAICWCRR
jgi:general secretion pathway protein F